MALDGQNLMGQFDGVRPNLNADIQPTDPYLNSDNEVCVDVKIGDHIETVVFRAGETVQAQDQDQIPYTGVVSSQEDQADVNSIGKKLFFLLI